MPKSSNNAKVPRPKKFSFKMELKMMMVPMLLLTGCMTAEEVRQQHQAKCMGYGFQTGTSQFANCMMQLDKLAERDKRCSSAWLSAYGAADPSRGFGYAVEVARQAEADCLAGRQPRPPTPSAPPRPTTNSTCTTSGNTLNCVHF